MKITRIGLKWLLPTFVAATLLLVIVPSGSAFFSSNRFYSPSGNIQCKLVNDGLGRSVLACTTFNNGRIAYLYRYSRAYTTFDNGFAGFGRGLGPTLAYNSSWNGNGFHCLSLTRGMQCENLSGHGFTIAREGLSRF